MSYSLILQLACWPSAVHIGRAIFIPLLSLQDQQGSEVQRGLAETAVVLSDFFSRRNSEERGAPLKMRPISLTLRGLPHKAYTDELTYAWSQMYPGIWYAAVLEEQGAWLTCMA
jgi:hypothetical protein